MLKITDYKLPKETFGTKVNLDLLAHVFHVQEDRAHVGLRNTKTRSEVNRTTKKVYKQKGTGGARHGSRRANLFVGGGIIFGPRTERRILTLPRTLKNTAKLSAFSYKAKEKQITVVSGMDKVAKTKEISEFLKKSGVKNCTILLADKSKDSAKFYRNLKGVRTMFYKDVSAFEILRGGMLFIDEGVFEKEVAKKVVAKKETKVVSKAAKVTAKK